MKLEDSLCEYGQRFILDDLNRGSDSINVVTEKFKNLAPFVLSKPSVSVTDEKLFISLREHKQFLLIPWIFLKRILSHLTQYFVR